MNRDPFAAIADPTRRNIIGILKDKPLTLNQISERFNDISRQAVSKQVRYLEESGLLQIEQSGRERYCYLQLQELKEVNDWLMQYEKFWNKKLDKLGHYLNKKK